MDDRILSMNKSPFCIKQTINKLMSLQINLMAHLILGLLEDFCL